MVNNSTNIDKTKMFTFHLIPLNIKKATTHEVGNPGHGLEQVHKYGGVKPGSHFDSCSTLYIRFHIFISGLLDVPICAVNDDGYFANPKYSLQFPPNAFNKEKLANQRIPVNAINVNSQLHPINTITGLQYFTGLNSYPWREKAVPKVGLGKNIYIF